MVHALEETWRVLVPGGWLLDLRPLSKDPPLEIVSRDQFKLAGYLDFSAGIPDDSASDRAINALMDQGAFVNRTIRRFNFAYYWETVEQMQCYVEDRWSDIAKLPKHVVKAAYRMENEAQTTVHVRIRVLMQLGSYKKHPKKLG